MFPGVQVKQSEEPSIPLSETGIARSWLWFSMSESVVPRYSFVLQLIVPLQKLPSLPEAGGQLAHPVTAPPSGQ